MSHRLQGTSTPGPSPRPTAEAFLEALQDRVYRSLGLTAEDCQARERVGQQTVLPERLRQKSVELAPPDFERYREALFEGLARDEAAPRPTRFERPHQYSILRDLKGAIERAVDRLSFELPVTPVIGTLPTRSLEPLMVPVPGSTDVVVVVDGSLLTYANLLSKAVAQALPFDGHETDDTAPLRLVDDWVARLDTSGQAGTHFLDLMTAALEGRPAMAKPYLPDARYEQISADLCESMELFMLAREYAHLIDGDHRADRVRRRDVNGQAFETLAWTGEQELKADSLALLLLLAAANEQGASLSWAFWAVDVLLASFGILERAAWLSRGTAGQVLPTPLPNVHDERRKVLRELLKHSEGGEQAVRFADALQPVLDHLEASLETHIYQERYAGVAVH
jgi:hypothetical protein